MGTGLVQSTHAVGFNMVAIAVLLSSRVVFVCFLSVFVTCIANAAGMDTCISELGASTPVIA